MSPFVSPCKTGLQQGLGWRKRVWGVSKSILCPMFKESALIHHLASRIYTALTNSCFYGLACAVKRLEGLNYSQGNFLSSSQDHLHISHALKNCSSFKRPMTYRLDWSVSWMRAHGLASPNGYWQNCTRFWSLEQARANFKAVETFFDGFDVWSYQ